MGEYEVSSGETDYNVHELGDPTCFPAEHGEDVLAQESDQKPVDASDHSQYKCCCVHIIIIKLAINNLTIIIPK